MTSLKAEQLTLDFDGVASAGVISEVRDVRTSSVRKSESHCAPNINRMKRGTRHY